MKVKKKKKIPRLDFNIKFYLKGSFMSFIFPQLLDDFTKIQFCEPFSLILPLIQHSGRIHFWVLYQRYSPAYSVPRFNGSALVSHGSRAAGPSDRARDREPPKARAFRVREGDSGRLEGGKCRRIRERR